MAGMDPSDPAPNPPRSHRWAPWWVLVAALGLLAAHQARLQPWTLDDAYIPFRYAVNVVAGHGPVFNPGERVEGYTSPLWLALLVVLEALGLDLDRGAKGLGAACLVLTWALMAAAPRWLRGIDGRVAGLALALVVTTGVPTRWALSGMETPLAGLAVVVALGLHLRERGGDDRAWLAPLTGLACGMAALARPDAALLFVALGVDRVVGARHSMRRLGAFAVPFAVVFGGWWAARWAWYGWFWPNPFAVKVGATGDQILRGLHHLGSVAAVAAPTGLLLLGATWRARLQARNPGLWGALGYTLLHLLYVVLVGGDVFWGWRFFAVVLPPMALLGAAAVADLADSVERPRWVWMGALGLCGIQLAGAVHHPHLRHRGWVARTGLEVGAWLRAHAPADALVATNIAGSIPYASGLPALDTLGLNDAHIARRAVPNMGRGRAGHEKGDGAYVLHRKPDVVILASSLGGLRPKFRGDHELVALDAFHAQYRFERYALPDGARLGLWVRRPEVGGRPLVGVTPLMVIDDTQPGDGLDPEPPPDDPEVAEPASSSPRHGPG